MEESNQTSSGRFILLGLSNVLHLQIIYFMVFLVMYLITLSGNFLVIIVVRINPKLHTPMYFFLSNLSVLDICFSSTIVPRLLFNTLSRDRSISLLGCALQMYFHLSSGATECVILAVMAYDRYVAICFPLRYMTIMSRRVCAYIAIGSWGSCLINAAVHVVLTFRLPFCRTHHVNHFFCELPLFFRMSCKDPWLNELINLLSASILVVTAFLLILISYIQIISTILKISSSQGRQKTFSTCASHLIVVSIYYGTIMSLYLRPHSAYSPEVDKAVSLIYTAVTPMLNPIIYSMRNKDVINTIRMKLIRQTLNH
ncbi:olfactory receptor 5AS1-like [Engystomops pustulosus]|uniref:olfactory receptor 5AS1-like n=1 Tax=Engystomops pustulosus TaxID=76066 RepID=UPI003AFB3D45